MLFPKINTKSLIGKLNYPISYQTLKNNTISNQALVLIKVAHDEQLININLSEITTDNISAIYLEAKNKLTRFINSFDIKNTKLHFSRIDMFDECTILMPDDYSGAVFQLINTEVTTLDFSKIINNNTSSNVKAFIQAIANFLSMKFPCITSFDLVVNTIEYDHYSMLLEHCNKRNVEVDVDNYKEAYNTHQRFFENDQEIFNFIERMSFYAEFSYPKSVDAALDIINSSYEKLSKTEKASPKVKILEDITILAKQALGSSKQHCDGNILGCIEEATTFDKAIHIYNNFPCEDVILSEFSDRMYDLNEMPTEVFILKHAKLSCILKALSLIEKISKLIEKSACHP